MNGRSILAVLSNRPARIVAVVGLTAGLGFALLTPPLAGYDEATHFLRAYQVSEGGLVATRHDQRVGGSMPRGLTVELGRLLTDGLYARGDHAAFVHRLGDPPPSGPKEFVDFAASAVYSPVVYAPAAIPIAIGRAFGASTLMLLYLGRIGSLLATIGLLSLAVRRMPVRAWALATVALLPVTVFQAAMLSADGITIALALLVLALALDAAATPRGELGRRRLAEIAIATTALGLAKPPYVLFAFAFAIAARRHRGAVSRTLIASVGAGLFAAAAWAAYASRWYEPPRLPPGYAGPVGRFTVFTHVDTHRQERLVLHHPRQFAQTIWHTVAAYRGSMIRETVAQVPLWTVPVFVVVVALAIVGSATLVPDAAPRRVVGWRSSLLLAGIGCATFVALMALAYVGWNAVGSSRVDAFQGRYLLPLVPIALVVLPVQFLPRRGSLERYAGALLSLASTLLLVGVGVGLRSHFY